jgi:hypothetical protein
MITAHSCLIRHRRFISRSCLITHAVAWAAPRGYSVAVTDALIDEWTRSKNRVISGPSLTLHQGCHGAHGEWPVLGSYRRLLAALRLREAGVTQVRELRLLLWASGYGGDEARLVGDLTWACAKMASRARQEMALEPEGRTSARTPLRIQRQVRRAAADLDPESIPGLTPDQRQLLGAALEDPRALDIGAALVDRMFRGSRPAVLDRLRSAAAGMPPGLPGPAEIVTSPRWPRQPWHPMTGQTFCSGTSSVRDPKTCVEPRPCCGQCPRSSAGSVGRRSRTGLKHLEPLSSRSCAPWAWSSCLPRPRPPGSPPWRC